MSAKLSWGLAILRSSRLPRYMAASSVALAVDMGCYLTLMALNMPPTPAAALAYSAGIAMHWLLSSRLVFIGDVAARGRARATQKLQFVLSALAGLALTTLLVGAGAVLGADPRLSKLVAVAASFLLTWLLRRHMVFARRAYGLRE